MAKRRGFLLGMVLATAACAGAAAIFGNAGGRESGPRPAAAAASAKERPPDPAGAPAVGPAVRARTGAGAPAAVPAAAVRGRRPPAPRAEDLRVNLAALAVEVLGVANQVRDRAGAPPLRGDPALMRAARRYSRELAGRLEIEHLSATPGRRTFRDRIHAEGARARLAGENLARLTARPDDLARRVVAAWLRSPGHRRNILDPAFTRTGIGVMLGRDGVWYVTQVYATPR